MKCPKSSYERRMGETAPEWQCPACGVAYAKVGAAHEAPPRPPAERSGWGGPVKLAFIGAAIAVVWSLQGPREAPRSESPLTAQQLSSAKVVMYSLTTCGYCNQKRAQLKAAGIPFVEYFIDTDSISMAELSGKLQRAGYRGGGIGTPTFEVNGTMLPNNPSMSEIRKHL